MISGMQEAIPSLSDLTKRMDASRLLAVPSVTILICFLSFSSQYLFHKIDPGPLTAGQTRLFNGLITSLLICYFRSWLTDPGRVPKHSSEKSLQSDEQVHQHLHSSRQRWCRKCEAIKPPRAHHCRECKRCVPKMDHHCVWMSNCVSYRVFPHFVRFLVYAVSAMTSLEYFLYLRLNVIWENRQWPSYLGPSVTQLIHLLVLSIVNSIMLIGLSILLVRVLWNLCSNTTTIEEWEIDRHRDLLRRAKPLGGFLYGPGGIQVKIEKQEFPYDIGIWKNICQGMGTSNVLSWMWPLSSSLPVSSGIEFDTNGFEDPNTAWPPPDPDRIPMPPRKNRPQEASVQAGSDTTSQFDVEAFKKRQIADLKRRNNSKENFRGLTSYEKSLRERDSRGQAVSDHADTLPETSSDGIVGWRDNEGERLRDFGIDEDAEFHDQVGDDDIPISRLIARQKNASETA